MKTEVRSHQKCCASCFYWTGNRELKPNSSGMVFYVDDFYSVKTTGICSCGQGMYASKERAANSVVCQYYKKWYALK